MMVPTSSSRVTKEYNIAQSLFAPSIVHWVCKGSCFRRPDCYPFMHEMMEQRATRTLGPVVSMRCCLLLVRALSFLHGAHIVVADLRPEMVHIRRNQFDNVSVKLCALDAAHYAGKPLRRPRRDNDFFLGEHWEQQNDHLNDLIAALLVGLFALKGRFFDGERA